MGDLVTITPVTALPVVHVAGHGVKGIIIKIEEGSDFGDGPVQSMVSVLTPRGIQEVTSRHVSLHRVET